MGNEQKQEILNSISGYKAVFEKYNEHKLATLYKSIADPNKVTIFDYIPLLLHINQPDFPGYIQSALMPAGIYGYKATNNLLPYLRSKHPAFIMPSEKKIAPFIEMFALMGSGGTIAFTSESDYDFWVCIHEDKLDREALRLFDRKCKLIETWVAETHNMEVHFFINDIQKVKKNIFDEDEEYGISGTSLGQLLKDEFLRSSIVISGKIPFWWAVPANCTDNIYGQWIKTAMDSQLWTNFIDLGNLSTIKKEDFFISALFQILKSIGNPFKSIIKLGLLEKYLSGGDESQFLSSLIKKNVHEGKLDIKNVDAYYIMFQEVFDHYTSMINDPTSINIIKTCFYLKVNPRLSTASAEDKSGKTEVMRELIKKWGWNEAIIKHVDGFEEWDIDALSRLMTNTKKYILKGYKQILSNLESSKIIQNIQKETLQGISSKIYSHFMPAENKIDNTLSFRNASPGKILKLEFVRDRDKGEFWILSKRYIVKEYVEKIIIQKSKNIFNIIVWIALNGLYKKDFTRMDIDAGLHMLDPNFIKELINELSIHFTFKRVSLKHGYFLKNAFPIISYIIINPLTKYSETMEQMVLLYHNSWGETRFEIFKNEADLTQIMTRIINSGLMTRLNYDTALRMTSSYPYHGKKEFKRLTIFTKHIYSFFVEDPSTAKKKYITMFGNRYFIYSMKKGGQEQFVQESPCDTELKMLYSLAYNRGIENKIMVDPTVPELRYIGKILESYSGKAIQIYFQSEKKYCTFFVMDERGSLIFFRKKGEDFTGYLTRLYMFAENAANAILEINPKSALAEDKQKVKIYKLDRDINFSATLKELNPQLDLNLHNLKTNIPQFKLSLNLMDSGDFGYKFTLPDGTFSEIFSRNEINTISAELKVLMENTKGYSYHVTDISLMNAGLPMYQNYTSLAFSEKNRFEMMVERGLKIS